jgi:hypothetical protein
MGSPSFVINWGRYALALPLLWIVFVNLILIERQTLSSYRIAIDHTTQTIDRRAKHYRNLIVVVTFVSLGSILWAGIVRSWSPLAGIFLLVPLCGLYFFFDEKLLNQWRHELFAQWEKGKLDFRALYDAVTSISTLPKNSVESMLETLPSVGDLVTEQSISSSTRHAIAAVVTAIHACRSDHVAFKAAGYSIAGGVLIAAVVFWMWQPILGLFALSLVLLLRRWVKIQRLKGAKEKIIKAQQEPEFNLEKFLEIVSKIHWSPISASEKETFLTTLCGAA